MTMNKGLVGFVLTLMALVVFSGAAIAQKDPHWVQTSGTEPLPINAEIGGSDKDGLKLPLCWSLDLGGTRAGKVFQKKCLIPLGGREITTSGPYLVYVGRVRWQTGPATQMGNLNAITGAIENGLVRPLCQAGLTADGEFRGTYAGKVVDGKCLVGWASREWPVDRYKVGFDSTPLQYAWFSNKIYRIVSIKSGKGIKTIDPNRAAGSGLLQSGDTKTTNEQWRMYWMGGGYYLIHSFTTNMCLDSTGVTRTTNGPVQLRQCSPIDSQMWTVSTYEAGKSLITSKDTGRVLNVNLGSVDDGAAINLWERNNAPNQLWRFETVSTPASLQYQCEASLDGQVAWNRAGSTNWKFANQQRLCVGTKNPEGTIACFVDFIKTKIDDSVQAIEACRTK
jgi:hypothetical protein